MNKFGVSLIGKTAIMDKRAYYKPNTQKPTRTIVVEGGPGADPKAMGGLGLTFGARTITARFVADGDRDILDVDSLECYLDEEGREVLAVDASEEVEVAVCPAKGEHKTAPEPKAEVPASAPATKPAKAAPPTDGKVNFDAARCVELFKGGMKVSDIAVAMGYERGQGNNRVRGALKGAGVYS